MSIVSNMELARLQANYYYKTIMPREIFQMLNKPKQGWEIQNFVLPGGWGNCMTDQRTYVIVYESKELAEAAFKALYKRPEIKYRIWEICDED